MIGGIPLACWLVAFALTFTVVALAALADRDERQNTSEEDDKD